MKSIFRKATGLAIAAVAVAGLEMALVPAGVALADPEGNPNASCMGHEASAVSPPGELNGTYSQNGMPGVLQFVDEVVIPLTGASNRGQVLSSGPAQINSDRTLATHEACDEALGIPSGAE